MTYPRTTTKFTVRWDVDEDRLLVLDEGIDDVRTILKNFVVHITLTTRETSPVGEDHERQLFTVVEVTNGLGGLERGVRVPNTTSFLCDLLDRVGVGRVGGRDVLNGAGLDTNDTDRDTTEASATDYDSTGPAT